MLFLVKSNFLPFFLKGNLSRGVCNSHFLPSCLPPLQRSCSFLDPFCFLTGEELLSGNSWVWYYSCAWFCEKTFILSINASLIPAWGFRSARESCSVKQLTDDNLYSALSPHLQLQGLLLKHLSTSWTGSLGAECGQRQSSSSSGGFDASLVSSSLCWTPGSHHSPL